MIRCKSLCRTASAGGGSGLPRSISRNSTISAPAVSRADPDSGVPRCRKPLTPGSSGAISVMRPAHSSATTTQAESDCAMKYRSNTPFAAVFSGTPIAPILPRPQITQKNSGQFGSITATWSPLPMPSERKPFA